MKNYKKILIIMLLLFLIIPVSAATYKIRNGNIINPNGNVQTNPTETTQVSAQKNKTYFNNNNTDTDIIFTKANDENPSLNTENSTQKTNSTLSENSNTQNIETLKSKNENYLKEPAEKIDFDAIMAKYNRDPYAKENKIAINNNQRTNRDCVISTFSSNNEYSIWCKSDPDYLYYYNSIYNPTLNRIQLLKKYKDSREIRYTYKKYSSKWYFSGISIGIKENEHKYLFMYDKTSSGYKLTNYYIDDICYNAKGKYMHTRTVKKI